MAPTPSRISLRDESNLSWYFGIGQSFFEKSLFGASIKRADISAYLSKPCGRCLEVGFTNEDVQKSSRWFSNHQAPRDLDEEVWEKWRAEADAHQPRCHQCFGTGVIPLRKPRRKPSRTGYKKCYVCRGSVGDTSCAYCGGAGRIVTLPAFPVGEALNAVVIPNEQALERYALISRQLDRVPLSLKQVLAAFYGDSGARWGRTKLGRIFSLYVLTSAGKKLARYRMPARDSGGRLLPDAQLTPSEVIGVQAELEAIQPRQDRRQLLRLADEQARTLLASAAAAWDKAGLGDWRQQWQNSTLRQKSPGASRSPRAQSGVG